MIDDNWIVQKTQTDLRTPLFGCPHSKSFQIVNDDKNDN